MARHSRVHSSTIVRHFSICAVGVGIEDKVVRPDVIDAGRR